MSGTNKASRVWLVVEKKLVTEDTRPAAGKVPLLTDAEQSLCKIFNINIRRTEEIPTLKARV